MPLQTGSRIGSYEITSRLGQGGMGVVFRARDTKLGREVAIKSLPEGFAADRDRVQRLQREAQLLAALNHPNIAQIYGLEDSGPEPCIVMEFVRGETLAERLKQGAVPLDETLRIARQIAEALESAHEKGIVHRDLKPGNVMVLPDGTVKVLDFGLAKVNEEPASNAGLSKSPTMRTASVPGQILGTVAYMAPEQAKGLNADSRSDVFSFGCILYEMLTGRQAFEGESMSDILASVIKSEPDLNRLPPRLSPRLRDLLNRCLEKNPKNRWHAAADVRLELQAILDGPVAIDDKREAPKGLQWKWALLTTAGMLLSAAIAGIAVWNLRPSADAGVVRLSIAFPEANQQPLCRTIAISPDGTKIVYGGNRQLYLRSISELEAKPIPGTLNAVAATCPVFSPDSRSIAFWAGAEGNLQKIGIEGGASVPLARIDSLGLTGLDWTESGILIGQGLKEIVRVSEDGGPPETLLKGKSSEQTGQPHMLPDGKAFLFSTYDAANRRAQIQVKSLDSGDPRVLITLDDAPLGFLPGARYVPTGHLVYVFRGTLFAVPFDPQRLVAGSRPVALLQGIRTSRLLEPLLSISRTGTLLYSAGPGTAMSGRFNLIVADRDGVVQQLKVPSGFYETPRTSPDGKRLAFGIDDGTDSQIWVYDLTRNNAPNRLTFKGRNRFPIWSSDGQHIAYQSDREGDLAVFWQRVDGTGEAERLTTPEKGVAHVPESWMPKSDQFLFRAVQGSNFSLWLSSVRDRKPEPFGGVQSVNPTNAVFSPDGRWVAYHVREPGKNLDEIYVQPFPPTGAKYQLPISRDNHHPVWSRDGKELFYTPGPGEYSVVSVTTTPTFAFGNPTPIPQAVQNYPPGNPRNWDFTADGKFLGLQPTETTQDGTPITPQIHVVLNWFEELKQKVPINVE